ncbi:phage portal protein [Leuconostoc pseudomesenteroides]|uniref:phage portal protein n=1 Tax=Leuconostoc pseudomesenteroides TaxID=33968 RepID=UPI00403DD61B
MTIIDKIKAFFKVKGAQVGMVNELNKITDHPRIGISASEYQRINKAKRFFEGNFDDIKYHNTVGILKKRPYVSLNMAQVVSRRLASIIFNEKATITVDGDSKKWVADFLNNNDFNKNFERYLESGLALGGLAMRPYWNQAKKQMAISWIQAPVFYPLNSNTGEVSEAAIASVTTETIGQRRVFYTLLEFHEWQGVKDDGSSSYVIRNELYRSEQANIVGIKVPLPSYDKYADLEDEVTINGLQRPLFTYLKPAGFNNKDLTSPLGLSIFDNAENTLQQINDTYDQFNWEIKQGQRRVAVSESLMSAIPDKDGNVHEIFDPDQNVFMPIGGADMDSSVVKDLTTDIRSQQYIDSINQFIKTFEMQVGLSSGTFSFDAQGLKTATEVVSENSMTYQTRNSHLTMVERAIQELIVSAVSLAVSLDEFSGTIPELSDITVNFDDGVFTDKSAQLDYFLKGVAGGVFSKVYAISKILDISEKEAEAELSKINDENANVNTTDPVDGAIYGQETPTQGNNNA